MRSACDTLWRLLATAALALACLTAGAASVDPQYTYSLTPVYHFDSDLDSGGEVSAGGVMATLGRAWSLNERSSLGFRLDFDYQNWDFGKLSAFGGEEPWGNVYGFGISAPYSLVTGDGWIWNFTPTVAYSGESDARFADALEYGATLALIRRLRPDLTLGFGVGAFENIENTYVFPIVLIDWRINDDWRLTNPAQAGPAGPAGLELSYAIGKGWDTGLGATYRDERFRLDRDGSFPDGVGEHKYTVVFARVSRDLWETSRLGFYAGAEVNPELLVDDPNGNGLYKEDGDTALLLGISLVGQF